MYVGFLVSNPVFNLIKQVRSNSSRALKLLDHLLSVEIEYLRTLFSNIVQLMQKLSLMNTED